MADAAWPLIVSAVIAGASFGYVIQRGGFCLMRAMANLFLTMMDEAGAPYERMGDSTGKLKQLKG